MPDLFEAYAPICRIDTERREVWGIATTETVGHDGKILDFEASCRAFDRWPRNVREQHDPKKAVARAIHVEPLADKRQILVGVRVSRGAEDTWQKIQDGVLCAFSVKGPIHTLQMETVDVGGVRRSVPRVTRYDVEELSLVDRAGDADPAAQQFSTIIRSADLIEALDEGELAPPDDAAQMVQRANTHPPFAGSHSHEHAGPDGDHEHEHSHEDDANHDHAHPTASDADADDVTRAKSEPETPAAETVAREAKSKSIARSATLRRADESGEVGKGQSALQMLKELLAAEAAEYAAGEDESFDIQVLQGAIASLEAWLWGEQAESDTAETLRSKESELKTQEEMAEAVRGLAEATGKLAEVTTTLVERVEQVETTQAEQVQRAEPPEEQPALAALLERVARLEAQPMPGGPVLRTEGLPVEKLFPGGTLPGDHGAVSRAFEDLAAHATDPAVRERAQLESVIESIRAARDQAHQG